MKSSYFNFLSVILIILMINDQTFAATKTAAANGNWSTAATWTPSGVPVAADDVIIPSGRTVTVNNNYTIRDVTVQGGGTLTITSGKKLTMTGHLSVNGVMTMGNGNIDFASGKNFIIGSGGSFTFEPGTNTLAGTQLFTNGVESFDPNSTLIIKKWYDYTIPLGNHVTGNFGNLTLNSKNGSTVNEWRQQNQFASHLVLGTFSIDQAWITLDRSGAITTTNFNNVVLMNVNSTLSFVYGTHPSTVTVNMGNLTITDGTLSGIYNGNGNVNLNISGNITLNGMAYLFLIENDGVSGVGNGNANLTVTGNFTTANSSDFFGIYNQTTTSAGNANVIINGNLNHNGDDFMVHYAIHTGSGFSTLYVNGTTTVNYNSGSQFWITGLSSISGVGNTNSLIWRNTGNVLLTGNSGGSLTTHSGSGPEYDSLLANLTMTGGYNYFSWPWTAAQLHPLNMYVHGNTSQSGSSTTFGIAYYGGAINATFNGNFDISGGIASVNDLNGATTINVNGNYNQSGGKFYLHKNSSTAATNSIAMNVYGNFTLSADSFLFDNNISGQVHELNLYGPNFNISGNAGISRSGQGTGLVFGHLKYARNGTINYNRTGSAEIIQVKQTILSGTTVDVGSSNFRVTSHNTAANDYLKIVGGGKLIANASTISPSGNYTNSGIMLESGAILELTKSGGFYHTDGSSTLSSNANMNFSLDPGSTIAYTGSTPQRLTGTTVSRSGANHKYGNLIINNTGSGASNKVTLDANNVHIRTNLNLVDGELELNGYTLSISNGAANAISRSSGFIRSETNAANNTSIVLWQSITTGTHIVPFGVDEDTYLPITMTVLSGAGADVTFATRATNAANNLPWPSGVTSMSGSGNGDQSSHSVIDRWWNIQAPGVIADLTLSYDGANENTIDPALRSGNMGIQVWNGTYWPPVAGTGSGVTVGEGQVSITGLSTWGPLVIVSSSSALPIELIYFKALLDDGVVKLKWATAAEINNDFFTIERSSDGRNFTAINSQPGAGNSNVTKYYSADDDKPLNGFSYYRLKQTDFDGRFSYSDVETIKQEGADGPAFEIVNVAPNPFSERFELNYMVKKSGQLTITLMNTSGQMVKQDVVTVDEGFNTYKFEEGASLNKGVYIISIADNEQKITNKIIKN